MTRSPHSNFQSISGIQVRAAEVPDLKGFGDVNSELERGPRAARHACRSGRNDALVARRRDGLLAPHQTNCHTRVTVRGGLPL